MVLVIKGGRVFTHPAARHFCAFVAGTVKLNAPGSLFVGDIGRRRRILEVSEVGIIPITTGDDLILRQCRP
jgi:hypothetical protein